MTTQSVNILVFHHPRPPYLYSLPVPQSTSTNPPTISNMPKLKAKPSIALNPKVPDDTDLVDDKEVPICDYQPHLKRFMSYTKQIHSHQALRWPHVRHCRPPQRSHRPTSRQDPEAWWCQGMGPAPIEV